jgi:hypothetical protein
MAIHGRSRKLLQRRLLVVDKCPKSCLRRCFVVFFRGRRLKRIKDLSRKLVKVAALSLRAEGVGEKLSEITNRQGGVVTLP